MKRAEVMGNNAKLVAALANDFFNQRDTGITLNYDVAPLRKFAEQYKQPSDDGFYYVSKSEIKKVFDITDDDDYTAYVRQAMADGKLERAGKWYRLVNKVPSISFGVTNMQPSAGACNVASQSLPGILMKPPSTMDPLYPEEGDMYFNTAHKEMRVYDGQEWLRIATEPVNA
jgi:hypothetical protein